MTLITPLHASILPEYGKWTTLTVNAKTSPDDKNPVVELTGDVTMTGGISVANGYTLTIRNAAGRDCTILNEASSAYNMFTVAAGGKLIIEGTEDANIIIDGGADFVWSEQDVMPYYQLEPRTGRKVSAVIRNSGGLNLDYVIIQNADDSDKNGAALHITSIKDSTLIRHSIIRQCRSKLGTAIYLVASATNSELCAVKLIDSDISRCLSGGNNGGDNTGGAIRTLATNGASLYLIGTTFRHNYAMRRTDGFKNMLVDDGNGGALFWNGRGISTTKCSIDGCLFEYNISDDNGGAIKTQGSIEFVNRKTVIRYNRAPNGGGLYIEGYTGGANTSQVCTIDYNLNGFLELTDNVSPSYIYEGEEISGKGAGVHLFFGNKMTLAATSTINVYLNGVTILRNRTSGMGGLGGGIYFEDTSLTSKQYKFNFNINYGILQANEASEYGGGIYIANGEIVSSAFEGEEMLIDGNIAQKNGGGIYIGDGSFSLATEGKIINNVSLEGDGAGVYVGGNFIMKKGIVKGNYADNGNGGGVFVNDGNFTFEEEGVISGNRAGTYQDGDGAGVYINGGDFTMNNGNIMDNVITRGNGGGIFINHGNFNFSNGNITRNFAGKDYEGNGGGICLVDGDVDISNGNITGNECGLYGGGLYVLNSGEEEISASFNGGDISENSARAGGGVAVNGYINLLIDRVRIYSNSAINGGGIYLYSPLSGKVAYMKFMQGMIYNNTAEAETSMTGGTGYNAGETAVNGVGGGIFLDNNSHLAFDVKEVFGLYGNTAHNAADDIFTNGNGTVLELPEVAEMHLTDFNIPAGELFWTEDYFENDKSYTSGLNGISTSITDPAYNLRYDYALYKLKRAHIIKVQPRYMQNVYACLTLGYEIFLVTLRITGLRKGESALFNIISSKQEPQSYITLTLTGKDDSGTSVSRKVALPDGTWRVQLIAPWSWTYEQGVTNITMPTITDETIFHFQADKKKILPDSYEKIDRTWMTNN